MNDNRSPQWRQAGAGGGEPGRPDRDAELFAVLDGADVSEPVRAAIDRALNERRDTTDYVDAILDRYASERDRRRNRPIPPAVAYARRRRYTLHLTFPAANLREARDSAAAYAEGLTILRPELVTTAPLLSRADAWNHVEPLFCGATGPDGDACVDVPEHDGPHRAAGSAGSCWTDDQLASDPPAGPGATTRHDEGDR